MNAEDKIKLFGMSHSLVERDLDKVEQKFKLELQREVIEEKDEVYYPQFTQLFRQEAAGMGKHYELFYCLEKSIRRLIADTLESTHGENWWETKVPENIKNNVKDNIQKECLVLIGLFLGITILCHHGYIFYILGLFIDFLILKLKNKTNITWPSVLLIAIISFIAVCPWLAWLFYNFSLKTIISSSPTK